MDFSTNLTRIDGFGFSEAFQRATIMRGDYGLTPENQRKILDLLFDTETGAGLSILRLGIGAAYPAPYDLQLSIQPNDPGGPDAPPQYEWNGDDGGQVWLSKEAMKYGVNKFYANAWSAPAYMKSNKSFRNGGYLCGVPGIPASGNQCAGADWRQAYANLLVQYVKFYQQEGIPITLLGFTNEPNLSVSYESMRFTPAQAVDFIKVLGPTVRASGLPLEIACCDAHNWTEQRNFTNAIEADPVARDFVDVHTGHQYGGLARTPLPTSKATWMTEYYLGCSSRVNNNWIGGPTPACDGIRLANDIHDTLTQGNVNAYVAWFGADRWVDSLIQMDFPGPDFQVAKRLWAMAAYSRFVRPDAYRAPATLVGSPQKISAFRNVDGKKVINIINNQTTPAVVDFTVDPGTAVNPTPITYLTDEMHSLDEVESLVQVNGDTLVVNLPPSSLTTIVLPPYTFSGFAAPIRARPAVNVASAGEVIPVKYGLTDSLGGEISDLNSFVSLQTAPASCDGTQAGELEPAEAPGATTIRYDSTTNQFIFNWKTDKSWTGCRVLELTLGDGTKHTAVFEFR
ncbi:MAG: PxKF domain-containing protein [bacterium]